MDPLPSTTQSSRPQQQVQSQPQHQQQASVSSSAPQIRSRITVVCAECKRLKLKCDRRNPCGSCTKRDTVVRCIYSPAAAEKVDLHSLNNRLIQVETTLAQFTAALPLNSPITPSHPPGSGPSSSSITAPRDRVSFAGSVLSISQDDLAGWLDHLDVDKSISPSLHPTASPHANFFSDSANPVKPEPTTVYLPLTSHGFENNLEEDPASAPTLPCLDVYHSSSSTRSSPTIPSATFPSMFPSQSSLSGSTITPALLAHLPVPPYRILFLDYVQRLLLLRPSFNWSHFRDRIEHLFNSFDETPYNPLGTLNPGSSSAKTKAQTAREIFFGSTSRSPSRSSRGVNVSSRPRSTTPTPSSTASFFAATAAAFALGALLAAKEEQDVDLSSSVSSAAMAISGRIDNLSDGGDRMAIDNSSSSARRLPSYVMGNRSRRLSPTYLHALSAQALSVHEATAPLDVDYLIACILQLLFYLQGGRGGFGDSDGTGNMVKANGGMGGVLLPLIGKMVNIARQLGLSVDPDDAPGRYNAKDAEMRRMVWWEVFYYDLFVSDCTGHPPLITDGSYTTRLSVLDDGVVEGVTAMGSKYLELKCQLAQFVRSAKRLAEKGFGYGIDQAAAFEYEVRTWLDTFPEGWKLGADMDMAAKQLPDDVETQNERVCMAQRCELAIGAQRLVMKVYAPFLRVDASTLASNTLAAPSMTQPLTPSQAPLHQAVHGAVNAAHVIVRASKLLWAAWGSCEDSSSGNDLGLGTRKRLAVTPALFDFCSFERGLVDAAVVCALAAVRQQGTVWATVAWEDIGIALDVVGQEGVGWFGDGSGWNSGLGVGEAVKIVEALWRKVEVVRGGPVGGGRTKRKHSRSRSIEESAVSRVSDGTSVARDVNTLEMSTMHVRSKYEVLSGSQSTSVVGEKEKEAGEREKDRKEKEKKHAKKGHYPAYGIRVRPGRETSPTARQRTGSTPTTSNSSDGKVQTTNVLLPPPPQQSSHAPSLSLPSTSSSLTLSMMGAPRTPVMSKSPTPSSTELTFQQQQQSIVRISAQAVSMNVGTAGSPFAGEEDLVQRRRFSIHDLGSSGPTHHHSSQPHTRMYQEYGGDPSNSNMYGPHSFDQARNTHPRPSSSFVPPLASPFVNGTGSGPCASSASASLSPGFGPATHTHSHLPSSPQFASRGHRYDESTSLFGPSLPSPVAGGPPRPSTSAQGLYMQSEYDGSFGGLGSGMDGMGALTSSVPGTPSPQTHVSVYDVKPTDRLREGSSLHQHQHQVPYQVDGGHNPTSTQDHGLSLVPPQSWPQTSSTEFWNASGGSYFH